MKRYHDGKYACFHFLVYIPCISSKKMQKSSAIQNNSVALPTVCIAIIVYNTFIEH